MMPVWKSGNRNGLSAAASPLPVTAPGLGPGARLTDIGIECCSAVLHLALYIYGSNHRDEQR